MADSLEVTRSAFITFLAGQDGPQFFRTTFRSDDPRTICPWRIMSNMLVVTTCKLSDPVLLFILVVANDGPVHADA
jgi:hypothetical protein